MLKYKFFAYFFIKTAFGQNPSILTKKNTRELFDRDFYAD